MNAMDSLVGAIYCRAGDALVFSGWCFLEGDLVADLRALGAESRKSPSGDLIEMR